jgi:hypothetical protein
VVMIYRFNKLSVALPVPSAPDANAASCVQELLGGTPRDGQELVVKDEIPAGAPWPELQEEPQISAPGGIDPEMIKYFAKAL